MTSPEPTKEQIEAARDFVNGYYMVYPNDLTVGLARLLAARDTTLLARAREEHRKDLEHIVQAEFGVRDYTKAALARLLSTHPASGDCECVRSWANGGDEVHHSQCPAAPQGE